MKNVILSLCTLAICLSLFGCGGQRSYQKNYVPNEFRYDDTVKRLIGTPEDTLISQWGIPSKSTQQNASRTTFTYKTETEAPNGDILICTTHFQLTNHTVTGYHFSGEGCIK